MKLPILAAEATLRNSRGFRLVVDKPPAPESRRVMPAAVKGSYTMEGHDRDEYCLYRICVFTWYDGPPYFTTNCSANWICGHKGPS